MPNLAAGASHSQTTMVPIPAGTAPGAYWVIAKADWANTILETVETNNTARSSSITIGPDLVVSAVSAPATAAPGGPLTINETTRNQGSGTAASSVVAFYLSTNLNWDAVDVRIGSRFVSDLAAGASQSAATTVTIPASTTTGAYYIIARADDEGTVAEVSESNNVRSTNQVAIGPDLAIVSVSAPAATAAGATMVVTDTTRNQGSASAAASRTAFYLSTNTTFDAADVRLGDRAVPVLNAGAQQLASTTLTVPASTVSGVYYVIARADDLSSVSETSESNNTRASASLTIGPDLVVTSVTAPVDAGAGSPLTVTDTVKNIGTGASPSVAAALYLSTNTTLDTADVALAQRTIPALAQGATNTASTVVTIPAATATGYYYIIEHVDADGTALEASESNNTGRTSLIRIGPDLALQPLSAPSSAVAGASIVVTDTTVNIGGGAALASTTTLYLSTNLTLDAADTMLGSRSVPALTAGATSTGSTTVVLSATLPAGTYYLFAKADATDAVSETFEGNNTRLFSITVSVP